jgi:MinD superfamily P-loop ATPase
MIIAVASGKGGTGKTTVAVAMAVASEKPVQYIDCDVEEPNGSIFIKPEITGTKTVTVQVPVIDEDKCTSCGKCARFCRFNALVSLGTPPMVFPELCHSCGGCEIVCPAEAISWKELPVGELSFGKKPGTEISVIQGKLNVGSVLAPPIIKAAKKAASDLPLTIVDCPPGTSCPVIEAISGADHVLLVTEPTPFGLHDLKLAVETATELKLPFSVVINRFDEGDQGVEDYCRELGIPVHMRIPHSRKVAEVCSRGGTILEGLPEMKALFSALPSVIQGGLK